MKSQRGFTLLEVMVSMALLALIVTLLWYSFSNAFLAVDQVGRDSDVVRQARQVTNRMRREMSMAYMSRHQVNLAGGLQDINQISFGFISHEEAGGDRVDFTSVAHTKLYKDFNESDQCEIGYYLEPDRKRRGLYKLMRRVDVTLDNDIEEGGQTYPIAYNVKELQFRYYDKKNDEWVDYWDTSRAETANRLPWAIEMAITFEDPDERERVWVTRTRVRMAEPQEAR